MFRLILAPKQLNWVSRAHARTNALANWVTTKKRRHIGEFQSINTWTFQENKAMHFFPHEGIKFRFNLEHFCQVYKKPGNRSIRQLGHEENGTDGKSCFLTGKYDSILWIRTEPFNFCRSAFYRVLVKMSTNQKGLSFDFTWCRLGLFFPARICPLHMRLFIINHEKHVRNNEQKLIMHVNIHDRYW